MAKNKTKVYFWLKFDKNFFNNLVIKNLRRIASGDTYVLLYQRMMLESLEEGGVIYYEGALESIYEEIAMKLDENVQDIKMTISYFVSHNLIQIDSNQDLTLLQVPALLESETNWNRYKRKKKEEKQQIDNSWKNSNRIPTDSNFVPTEIEIDKEIELDIRDNNKSKSQKKNIEIDTRDKSKSNNKSQKQSKEKEFSAADALKTVSDYFQQEIGVLSPNQFEQLSDYITITKMEVDVVKSAITKAADNSKRSFGYVNSILRNWRQNGIKTMVQVEEEERDFKEKKGQSQNDKGIEKKDDFF